MRHCSRRTERCRSSNRRSALGLTRWSRPVRSRRTPLIADTGNTSRRRTPCQICSSRSTPSTVGSHAWYTALIAPTDEPTTKSAFTPAAASARSMPTSTAPRLPPAANTNAVPSGETCGLSFIQRYQALSRANGSRPAERPGPTTERRRCRSAGNQLPGVRIPPVTARTQTNSYRRGREHKTRTAGRHCGHGGDDHAHADWAADGHAENGHWGNAGELPAHLHRCRLGNALRDRHGPGGELRGSG